MAKGSFHPAQHEERRGRQPLTSTEQLHHQPQLILHHKGGVVGHDVGMVALAHSLDLLLQEVEMGERGFKTYTLQTDNRQTLPLITSLGLAFVLKGEKRKSFKLKLSQKSGLSVN